MPRMVERVAIAIAARRDAYREGEKVARDYYDDARTAIEAMRPRIIKQRIRRPFEIEDDIPLPHTPAETPSPVGWTAYCPATGGRIFAYTEPEARRRASETYSTEVIIEPVYTLTPADGGSEA